MQLLQGNVLKNNSVPASVGLPVVAVHRETNQILGSTVVDADGTWTIEIDVEGDAYAGKVIAYVIDSANSVYPRVWDKLSPEPAPVIPTILFAVGKGGGIMRGVADDPSWSIIRAVTNAAPFAFACSAPGGSVVVAGSSFSINGGGEGIFYSTDGGLTFTQNPTGTLGFGYVSYFLGKFWGLFHSQIIRTSPDGVTWTNLNIADGGSSILQSIGYNGSRILAVDGNAQTHYSDNGGTSWTFANQLIANTAQPGTFSAPTSLAWDGQAWWVGGTANLGQSTDNGITFVNRRPSVGNTSGTSYVASNGAGQIMVVWFAAGVCWFSTDYGATFAQQTLPTWMNEAPYLPVQFLKVGFVPASDTPSGGYWLRSIAGGGLDISPDGTTWSQITPSYPSTPADTNPHNANAFGFGGYTTG